MQLAKNFMRSISDFCQRQCAQYRAGRGGAKWPRRHRHHRPQSAAETRFPKHLSERVVERLRSDALAPVVGVQETWLAM